MLKLMFHKYKHF